MSFSLASANRRKVEWSPKEPLPGRFTLIDLQCNWEVILGRQLDKGAFRRKIADESTRVSYRWNDSPWPEMTGAAGSYRRRIQLLTQNV